MNQVSDITEQEELWIKLPQSLN